MTTGNIGVATQDLFPIIKKFLYSDHEIFIREIVSNAVDATQKLKTLAASGEFSGNCDDLKVVVKVDKDAGTLTVSDQGIGMTKEEVEKYINQIAFSGAEEFLNKYKDNAHAIIGHFGLGFYSSFMVSDKVEIITKSYKDGSKAVKWSCSGTTEYSMEEVEKDERGTDVIMYITEEEKDFLDKNKLGGLLHKYGRFLPVPIIFGKETEWKDGKSVETDKDHQINNTTPAWVKKPADLKEEDYRHFYEELYPMGEAPLFHIHLNVDFPFTLTGILYFPKINSRLELQRNKIQLYANQVYVTDSVEGIVPDYLTLLHGVIDSPDIPLNVSRSYLQSDRNVKKISAHITKKVADSLQTLLKDKRSEFEGKWDDLKIFVQYGMLSDEKFSEKAMDFVLLKNTDNKYFTLSEYENCVKENQTDKDSKIVYLYATDVTEQYSYIQAAKAKGYDVLVMDGQLDTPFMNFMEQKNDKIRMLRVDSDVIDRLIVKKEEKKEVSFSAREQKEMNHIFTSLLPKEGGMYMVSLEALGENADPVVVTRSEYMRRMKEMAEINPQMSFYGKMGDHFTLVVNTDHALVKKVLDDEKAKNEKKLAPLYEEIQTLEKQKQDIQDLNKELKPEEIPSSDQDRIRELEGKIHEVEEKQKAVCANYATKQSLVGQLIDIALLSNGLLKGERLHQFLKRSVEVLK